MKRGVTAAFLSMQEIWLIENSSGIIYWCHIASTCKLNEFRAYFRCLGTVRVCRSWIFHERSTHSDLWPESASKFCKVVWIAGVMSQEVHEKAAHRGARRHVLIHPLMHLNFAWIADASRTPETRGLYFHFSTPFFLDMLTTYWRRRRLSPIHLRRTELQEACNLFILIYSECCFEAL